MNGPKAPNESDWQNVDIFVFSNGQHQTPPRKYHLASEDLNSWSSTLMTLAHSQYEGVFSSIDLYTVEGQRVQTPIQISNGSAYVAVPPRDTFIPAGYSEYLLRATRSREKRQSKSSNNAQVEVRQGELDQKLQATEIEANEEEIETTQMNEEVATSTIGDPINPTQKPLPHYSARSNNTIKQIEKVTANNQNSTILRKQNSLMPQPTTRKTSMKMKDNPLRKNLKVNTLKGTNNTPSVVTNGSNQVKTNAKSITRTGKSIERETSLKNVIVQPKIEKDTELPITILGRVISSTEKTFTTENTALENVIDDNELIVVKTHDSENKLTFSETDKIGSIHTRQTRLSSMVPILMPIDESSGSGINKDETPVTVMNNLMENVYKPESVIKHDIKSKSITKLQLDESSQERQSETVKLFKKTPVDSYVAMVDQGDVINFTLKIEVRKGDSAIKLHDPKTIHCITEKALQVNAYQEIDETIVKSSSCTKRPIIDEDNQKIVVIQCSCFENHNISDLLHKIDTGTVNLNDKKYVMLLPDPESNKSVERQHRTREESKIVVDKYMRDQKSSVDHPVKKVYATTSIQRLTASKTTQDDGVIISNVDARVVNEQDKPEVSEVNRKLSSIQKIYQADSVIITKNKLVAHRSVDNSTQTEWCTMLLEARRDEDGRYSFYLPPLSVVKYYGL